LRTLLPRRAGNQPQVVEIDQQEMPVPVVQLAA